MKNKNQKVFVAMSGGVDSSVAAGLLKNQGYRVTGVFFKPWQPENDPDFCNWKQDRQDALRVAVKLKIPFLTWDFSGEYYKKVAKYMINSYKSGITPNPDVMCNREIKFGLFLKKALKKGADFVATGHYVRLKRTTVNNLQLTINKINKPNGQMSNVKCQVFHLLSAKDGNKDQSYFLWTLTQGQLNHCLFPIGDYMKSEVRGLAKRFGLPNWNKKDSQGVCFVGDLDIKEFLKEYIGEKRGEVQNLDNKIIGEHDGVSYYTIGQRHGFKTFNGKIPYYIIGKDLKNNILYADRQKVKNDKLIVRGISWVNKPPQLPINAELKIRYRHKSQKALIKPGNHSGMLAVKFKTPQTSVTPGQSAVIYKRDELLGGGIII